MVCAKGGPAGAARTWCHSWVLQDEDFVVICHSLTLGRVHVLICS